MQTSIQQVSPVEYELEIKAAAEDIAPELEKALRTQRARTNLKGFRPGKVPLQYVKKMYGRALTLEIAERQIQDRFQQEVLGSDTYKVIGRPQIVQLDADVDKDLHAVVRFGVRPEFDLKDISGQELPQLNHEVNDKEIDEHIQRVREKWSELKEVDEPVGEDSFVLVDLQRLDDATRTPLVGEKESDVGFFLNDERLKEPLKEGLLGKKKGDTFQVDIPHEHHHHEHEGAEILDEEGHEHHHHHDHSHPYEVTIKEVQKRDLIEIDEDFARNISQGQVSDPAELKDYIRKETEKAYTKQARELLEDLIIDRMVDLNQVEVPESAIETVIEQYLKEFEQQQKQKLPEDFDFEGFAQAYRDRAIKQIRWMLIRDKIIEAEQLKVTDEDFDAYWEQEYGSQYPPETMEFLRSMFKKGDSRRESLDERILTQKVVDLLATRATLKEMDQDAYMEALAAMNKKDEPAEEATPEE